MNADRKRIGKALTAVLDAAEKVGVSYESAVGFFSETDYQLIRDGEYQSQHIEHALRVVRSEEWPESSVDIPDKRKRPPKGPL